MPPPDPVEVLSWWAQIAETCVAVVALLAAGAGLYFAWQGIKLQLTASAEDRKSQLATAKQQAKATTLNTLATIVSTVQNEKLRESRRFLFEHEADLKNHPYDRWKAPYQPWQEEWIQAADRVSQSFNTAGIVSKTDPELQEVWIRPTRRAIVKSWENVQPRVDHRRHEQNDLWEEFEWLAKEARQYIQPTDKL